MWEEDELPEGDLESVYGRAAMYARIKALTEGLFKKYDETERRLAVLAQRQVAPEEHHDGP